ncbi:YfiR family protein [Acinetobacter sp. NIPH 2699]|uniref:YfiR family protein n=1 Tax=Acinetobacter sp. NIPH 2699 TaxID=2923433 RepID=UPI001F4C0283|nr:YfiR family protein [Acinetobacter sp. NIPH 2699]MCH7337713.1 YfiR family protein [Acinetobacter sp. NIPH 2699]
MQYLLFVVLCSTSQFCYATSNHSFYELALSILSYSKWSNTTRPTICVLDNSEAAAQFQVNIRQLAYDYQVLPVNIKDFTKTDCHVVYFSTTSPQQQHSLIQSYPSRSLLSLSANNPACEVGSIFCLYNKKNFSTFKVNLDALSDSKVHIDPRVLLLAKNAE